MSATDGPAYAAIVVAMTATGLQTPLSIVSPSPCNCRPPRDRLRLNQKTPLGRGGCLQLSAESYNKKRTELPLYKGSDALLYFFYTAIDWSAKILIQLIQPVCRAGLMRRSDQSCSLRLFIVALFSGRPHYVTRINVVESTLYIHHGFLIFGSFSSLFLTARRSNRKLTSIPRIALTKETFPLIRNAGGNNRNKPITSNIVRGLSIN